MVRLLPVVFDRVETAGVARITGRFANKVDCVGLAVDLGTEG